MPFFAWLVKEGLTESNVAKDLKASKVTKKVVTALSDQEIGAILNLLNPTSPSDARNRTIFMILLNTRLHVNLTSNHVQYSVRGSHHWTTLIYRDYESVSRTR